MRLAPGGDGGCKPNRPTAKGSDSSRLHEETSRMKSIDPKVIADLKALQLSVNPKVEFALFGDDEGGVTFLAHGEVQDELPAWVCGVDASDDYMARQRSKL